MNRMKPQLKAMIYASPQLGFQNWLQLMVAARHAVKHQQWEEAIHRYRAAITICETLLRREPNDFAKDLLLQAAAEYVYAARRSEVKRDAVYWVHFFEKRLKNFIELSENCVQPLKRASFEPIAMVSNWLHIDLGRFKPIATELA